MDSAQMHRLILILVVFHSTCLYGGSVVSTTAYQLCNLTASDPIQPSFLNTTCEYFTRITTIADGGIHTQTVLPLISMVGNPTVPFRAASPDGSNLVTCGAGEICTETTPIKLTFTTGEMMLKWSLQYAGFSLPWSYVVSNDTTLPDDPTCYSTGSIVQIPVSGTPNQLCDAGIQIGPVPDPSCPSSGMPTCPPTSWELVQTQDCYRMCCSNASSIGSFDAFVWRTNRNDGDLELDCKAYRPHVQPFISQSLTVSVESTYPGFASFTMTIPDTSLTNTASDHLNSSDPMMPLIARLIQRAERILTLPPRDISIPDAVSGAIIVICVAPIQDNQTTVQRPSCTTTPPREWIYIPSPYSARYGTSGTDYGVAPLNILNAMSQSTEVCGGMRTAASFVPGYAIDPSPINATISDKYSPSLCDMFAQTELGDNYWLPPKYNNTGGVAGHPNWFINNSNLYYVISSSDLQGLSTTNLFTTDIDLSTNVMEYIQTTAPGFFDTQFTSCAVNGYADENRTIATGVLQVRVCNEEVIDDTPITQIYTVTYTCDPRMTLNSTVVTSAPLPVGVCQFLLNPFTFAVSSVQLKNMSLNCIMVLSPGGDVPTGQASTVCNQFPNYLLPNNTCSSTDLSCINKKGGLLSSSFFWVAIVGGVILIASIIGAIVVISENLKKKHNTPSSETIEDAATPLLEQQNDAIYDKALQAAKTGVYK